MEKDDEAAASKLDQHIHFIPGLSALRLCDLPENIISDDLRTDFSVLLHRASNKLPSATAVVMNTFEGLSPELDAEFSSIFAESLAIGPFHLICPTPSELPEQQQVCMSWLDRQGHATVAYASFGTFMMPPPSEVAEIALGLEASGVPFLWSLKETAWELLPAGFLDRTRGRGLVVPWAPQAEVLEHGAVGAFVTHCGWNSVIESVASGVPMACRPFFGDQMMNARMVSHVWRFGVAFEKGSISKGEMERVLSVILREEEGKEMRERVGELKGRAKQATRPGGGADENLQRLLKIIRGSVF